MRYVDGTLAEGEHILHRARLHWMIFVFPSFIVLAGFAFLFISFSMAPSDAPIQPGGLFIGSFLLLAGFLSELKAVVNYWTTEIAATTRRFVVKRGLLRRNVVEMNAGQLESIFINQSIPGRVFGYGTIVVGGTGSGIDPVQCVAQPLEVRKAANRIGRGYQHEAEIRPRTQLGAIIGVVIGDGAFAFPVVGEAHHQVMLEHFAGGRSPNGANIQCAALVEPQPDNPYDPGAVCVRIRGEEVGFLARDVAPLFRQALSSAGYGRAACEAVIIGGWDRGSKDRGSFGVRLNARLPFRFQSVDEWKRRH